jgi:hypothetical protein
MNMNIKVIIITSMLSGGRLTGLSEPYKTTGHARHDAAHAR